MASVCGEETHIQDREVGISDNVFQHLPGLDASIDNLDDIACGRNSSIFISLLKGELGLLSQKAWSNNLIQVWQLQL